MYQVWQGYKDGEDEENGTENPAQFSWDILLKLLCSHILENYDIFASRIVGNTEDYCSELDAMCKITAVFALNFVPQEVQHW